MSANDNARARLQLVSTPLVLLAALLTAAVFLALFPSERMLREIAERRKSDVLSIAYLRLLLRTHPDDGAVALALAQAYMQAGEWNKARIILLPLTGPVTAQGRAAALALIEIEWQRYIGMAAADQRRTFAARELGNEVATLALGPMTLAGARRLAELAAALDRPAVSADLYEKLAVLDPAHETVWLLLAADAHVAAGAPARAAPILARLGSTPATPAGTRAAYAGRALVQWLAASDGKSALEFVARLLGSDSAPGEFADDPALLQQGVAIARAHSDNARAQAWGRRLLAQSPDDIARLSSQLEIELAAQALPQALVLAQRLVALAPDVQRREQLAQIALWSDRQALALQQWSVLARQNPAGNAMEQALALANSRAEDALWLELASLAMAHRPLKAAELAAITAVEQRNKSGQVLVRFLETYLKRHGGDMPEGPVSTVERQMLWRTLARQQVAIGDKEAALATWQGVQASGGQGFGAVRLALEQARLLERLERPGQATLLLDAVQQQAGAGDIAYWTQVGELAWQLKREPVALVAYQRAWDAAFVLPATGSGQPAPTTSTTTVEPAPPPAFALIAERLIALHRNKGATSEAVTVGRQAFAILDDVRWLLLAMDAAAAAGQWPLLRTLLAEAGAQPQRFDESDMYWLLCARSASEDRRLPEARAGYEKVLARNPGLSQARLGLLWMDVDHLDPVRLRSNLLRWENDATTDSAYWPVYAAAYESLRDYHHALPWLERQARLEEGRRERDPLRALHHAEVVVKAGKLQQAQRMRHAVYAMLRTRLGGDGGFMMVAYAPPAAGAGKSGRGGAGGTAPDKTLAIAYSRLAQEFSGNAASDRVLLALLDSGVDDTDVHEMLVASALEERNPVLAAERLTAAQARRHRLPVWQSMAVAMAGSDKQAIATILADSDYNAARAATGARPGTDPGLAWEPGVAVGENTARLRGTGTLAPTDKVEAMRVLGLNADALRYADSTLQGEEHAGNALLRRQRESLAEQQATRVRAGASIRRIGPLELSQQEAQVSLALDPVRATVRVGQTRFSSQRGEYGLDGITRERDFSLAVEALNDSVTPLLKLTLGTLQRDDHSPRYGRFEWARRVTPRAVIHVDSSFNMASDETAALRVFGMKDKAAGGVTIDLSDSAYTRFDAAGQRYRSRAGQTLGRGYRVAAEAGMTVLRDVPFWQLRVSGSWEKNRLADSLPPELLGPRLGAGALIGDVVAERFGLLALGSTVRFGDPDARPNRAYAQADLFAGHEWPAKRNAYGARVLFSMPVSAPDELRLEAYYSNAQRGTAAQASKGVGLTYIRPF